MSRIRIIGPWTDKRQAAEELAKELAAGELLGVVGALLVTAQERLVEEAAVQLDWAAIYRGEGEKAEQRFADQIKRLTEQHEQEVANLAENKQLAEAKAEDLNVQAAKAKQAADIL